VIFESSSIAVNSLMERSEMGIWPNRPALRALLMGPAKNAFIDASSSKQ
jgi:hypothetical protein